MGRRRVGADHRPGNLREALRRILLRLYKHHSRQRPAKLAQCREPVVALAWQEARDLRLAAELAQRRKPWPLVVRAR